MGLFGLLVVDNCVVAITIPTDKQLRSHSSLVSLVDSVFNAHPSDESDYLEWKSTLDLSTTGKASHFAVAKCVLGMANRPAGSAARHFGGCGYMVIGVEPGNVPGVAIPDMADLEPWINRYAGSPGPSWSAQSVKYQGADVLLVVVEPPKDGDPIYSLAKDWTPAAVPGKKTERSHQAGTIFVRHQARSVPASPDDLDMLQSRLLAGAGAPTISRIVVSPTLKNPVQALWLNPASRDKALESERRALELPDEGPAPAGFAKAFSPQRAVSAQERDRYVNERARYLAGFPNSLSGAAFASALSRLEGRLRLRIHNQSDSPLTDVRVQVRMPAGLMVIEEALDMRSDMTSRPKPPRTSIDILGVAATGYLAPTVGLGPKVGLLQRYIEVGEDNSEVVLRLPSVHPDETAKTDSFILVAPTDATGASHGEERRWTLTAVITAGNREGILEVPFEVSSDGAPWDFVAQFVSG